MAGSVRDVYNIEGALVALARSDGTNTTQVAAAGDHGDISNFKLEVLKDLASLGVDTDSVVHLDVRIWVADRASVVQNTVRDPLRAHTYATDLSELELGLFSRNAMRDEATLGIEQEAEDLVGALNCDNI